MVDVAEAQAFGGPDQIVASRQDVRTATKAAESSLELRRKLLQGVQDQRAPAASGGLHVQSKRFHTPCEVVCASSSVLH